MKNRRLIIGMCIAFLVVNIAYASYLTDNSQEDFNNGTYNKTFYNNSGFVQLNNTYSEGEFTSRLFDTGFNSQWNNISWINNAIGELPANQTIETKYGKGNINMTGNVLLFHLNEASGTIIDYSGNGHNGTENGGATYGAYGKFNTALEFDGNDDYIDTGLSDDLSAEGAFSVFAWVKDIQSGNNYVISQRHSIPPSGYASDWILGYQNGGLWFRSSTIDGSNLISDGKWHLLGFTFDGTTARLYIDSDSKGAVTPTGFSGYGSVKLMTRGDATSSFTSGKMDEVSIWNRSLSSDEILDLYKRGILRLNVTARSCDDSDCDTETWINLNESSSQNLKSQGIQDNQYFQYRFNLETDNKSYSPELYNITIDFTSLCTPNWTNTSWSDWYNISLCHSNNTINQKRNRTEYDTNNCGETNKTHHEYRTESCIYEGNWWNESWNNCKEYTIINSGSSDLIDFPAYINLSYEQGMQTDYKDIRIINSSCDNGGSELDFEIESYNTQKADVWVEIKKLSKPEIKIAVYYNNTGADSGENTNGTWNSDFGIVYHMDSEGLDSTYNNHDKVGDIGSPTSQNNFLGKGIFYDSDDAWNLTNIDYLEDGYSERAHEIIFKTSNDTYSRQTLFAEGGSSNGIMMYILNHRLYARWWSESTGWGGSQISTSIAQNTTYHAVMTYKYPGNIQLIVNGNLVNSSSSLSDINSHGGDGGIAYTGDNSKDYHDTANSQGNYFIGSIYEFRVMNKIKSIGWHNQTYNTIFNQKQFVIKKDETPPIITVNSPSDYSSYQEDWIELNASLDEAGKCNYSLDSSDYLAMENLSKTKFYKKLTNQTEGLHNITFKCTDLSGNSNIVLRYFTISFNPGCSNSLKDQDESDIDCGGICGSNCNDGDNCNLNSDCSSDFCENNICVSCSDGIKNNNESDIDCGGPYCSKCSDGQNCNNISDCESATSCYNGTCCSCSDKVLNQKEDLVDCGGPYCDACSYLLEFYDDCGNASNETHLVQGTDFTFAGNINSSLSDSEKSVSYHNEKVIFRYPADNMYDYQAKIKILQPAGDKRVQNILADSTVLENSRDVPEYNPEQYTYTIPLSSYKNDSSFDIIFEKVRGANAVCSEIEIWKSTLFSSSLSKSSYVFDFNVPRDYSYKSSEIIVANSSAHLKNKLICKENNSYYDFNPITNDLSYSSYNLKTVFNLSKMYDYYNYSIELKRDGNATGMFRIAVNNASNIINVANATEIPESYTVYTVNIPTYMIKDNTPEIWTLTKQNIVFRMDGTPLNKSYYRNANDNLNNTKWNLDNNDYYHMLIGYDNMSSGSGTIETDDLTVSGLLKWLNVSINDYNEDVFSNQSNESYDYASNQTNATAQAANSPNHLIDEDETVNGGDYYASCNWPCNMTINFNKSAYINKIYTHLWDGNNRYYNYSLWISEDGANWTKIVDNKYAQGPQNDTFQATLTKYIRIEGLHNTANAGFHIIEVDAFEAKKEKEIKYLYSTDSGTNWNSLPSNGDISNVSTATNKIKLKANITNNGILHDINVSYYTSIVANCSDSIKNQDETDVDCGGNTCSKCSNGKSCLSDSDCKSDLCSGGICKSSGLDKGGSGSSGGSSGTEIIISSEEDTEQEIKEPEYEGIIIAVKEISAGKPLEILFDKYLHSIKITSFKDIRDFLFKVRELDKTPYGIPKLNNTYQYIEINTVNLSDNLISEAIIKFEVNKSWLTKNNFNISMYRYANNKWNKLKTEKVYEDNKSVYYEAETPGFSYFAIAGEITEKLQKSIKPIEIPSKIDKPTSSTLKGIILILILILIITKFKKIKSLYQKILFKPNFTPRKNNSIRALIGKNVFTDEGMYCGKVLEAELDLKKLRIDNLKINTKKSYLQNIMKSKKGINLPFKKVKNVGDVVIINHINKKDIIKNKKK